MKHSIIRRLALVLALAVLLSMVGLAEELSLNALELPEIDMEGLSLEDVLIGEGDELELVDLGGEIELPGGADGTGVDTDAALPDGTAFLEDLDGAVDEASASIESDLAQNDFVLIDEEIEQTGGAGDGYWEDHCSVPGAQADNDALADAYLRCVLPGFGKGGRTLASPGTGRKMLVKKGLTGTVAIYDAIKPMIEAVAEGKRTSTVFEFDSAALGTQDHWWTPEDLGIANFDDDDVTGNALLAKETIVTSALMDALLQDCPYHLYWYEKKTQGMSAPYGWSKTSTDSAVQLTSMKIQMWVVDASAAATDYTVHALPGYVSAAVTNINAAISNNAGKSDYDKLTAYADLICGYVEYNDSAADDSTNTPYGNPWQLVWIFDGDPATKVVCEGYAKGFKYLCDLSDFQGDVGCALVTGILSGGTGSGGHMWNSLKMPDGKCYLVDLTNCDTGFSLFLKGCTGNAGGPYTCDGLSFKFDSDLADKLGGDTSWLTYSNTDYDPSAPVPDPTVAPTAKPTVAPTAKPTAAPTAKPTAAPTAKPTAAPTAKPTAAPTAKPTTSPTAKPSASPTATPTATPTASPTTSPTASPTAVPKVDLSKCKFTVKNQTYTGKALKPAVTVKYGKKTLKQGTDYTVSYKNNVKPGTATVTVTGKGDYTGSAKATFRILVPLFKCKLTVKSQTYTGKALKPAVTVKYGSKTLKKGTDYTVSYKNNKAVGVATVTVKGKGGYTGTKKVTFNILPRSVAISKLTAGKQSLTVKWGRRAEATGYELQYALKSSFAGAKTVKIKKNATVSATIKKLKTGKTYYVRLRSYKTVGKKTFYSAWSKGKGVKVK